jgi:hypothetical protein
MSFTFHNKPLGYWFSAHFEKTVKCPCCGLPGVSLRFPRARTRRLWAHAMDETGWLEVCERRAKASAPARLQARAWLAERWHKTHKPAELARELGLNWQLLSCIRSGRFPLPRSMPAVRAAFVQVGIPAESWDAPPMKYARLGFLAVFPRTPRPPLDSADAGC